MMKNKLLIPLIVVSLVGLVTGSSIGGILISKQIKHRELTTEYEQLKNEFQILLDDYEIMVNDYGILFGENEDLQNDFNELQENFNNLTTYYNEIYGTLEMLVEIYWDLYDDYNALIDTHQATQESLDMFLDMIINEIPMAQKMAFYYQFVRNYLEQFANPFNENYMGQLKMEEMMIIHASQQNLDIFSEVDSILENYGFFDIGSVSDMWRTMFNVYGPDSESDFVPLSFFRGTAIPQQIQTWMTNNLKYIYDSDTEWNKNWFIDFMQSPLETMMYCGGDCEDWTIFASTFLEWGNKEIAVASVHDNEHGMGSLHHSFFFMKVGNGNYGAPVYWKMNPSETNYDWIPVDTLWCETIGEVPTWLQWYYDYGDSTWIDDHIRWEIVDGIFD